MRLNHLLLAALALLNAPAFATTHTTVAANTAAASSRAKAVQSADRKYCIAPDETTTDTRLRVPECRTKGDWAKRGVDIDELQKQQQQQ
jgi:hypothetical protein